MDVEDKPKTKHTEASVPDTPLFGPRLTRISLDADDLTGPAEDSAPVAAGPLRAHGAGRRPILEHDVCQNGEKDGARLGSGCCLAVCGRATA